MATPTTIRDALEAAVGTLAAAGIDCPRADARILLAHALDTSLSRLDVVLRDALPEAARAQFDEAIAQRATRRPLAYITGDTEFVGFRFRCDERALVPRPETEVLVQAVAARLKRRDPAAVILDVGTGTGTIGLSLAKLLPEARVILTDISGDALSLAQENATALGLMPPLDAPPPDGPDREAVRRGRIRGRTQSARKYPARRPLPHTRSGATTRRDAFGNQGLTPFRAPTEAPESPPDEMAVCPCFPNTTTTTRTAQPVFLLGPCLDPVLAAGLAEDITCVVANPPYVAPADVPGLPAEVADHEPRVAWMGERADGLGIHARLIADCVCHLPNVRLAAFELGIGQAEAVRALCREAWPSFEVSTVSDLCDIERVVIAQAP